MLLVVSLGMCASANHVLAKRYGRIRQPSRCRRPAYFVTTTDRSQPCDYDRARFACKLGWHALRDLDLSVRTMKSNQIAFVLATALAIGECFSMQANRF